METAGYAGSRLGPRWRSVWFTRSHKSGKGVSFERLEGVVILKRFTAATSHTATPALIAP
jgi:hypothetical protein